MDITHAAVHAYMLCPHMHTAGYHVAVSKGLDFVTELLVVTAAEQVRASVRATCTSRCNGIPLCLRMNFAPAVRLARRRKGGFL